MTWISGRSGEGLTASFFSLRRKRIVAPFAYAQVARGDRVFRHPQDEVFGTHRQAAFVTAATKMLAGLEVPTEARALASWA
jgi:hypothetical protein